jgi:phospholipid/cholesterol/gamma-HCH transport system permease protein
LQPIALNRSKPQAYLKAQRQAAQLDLELTGEWRAAHFSELETELAAIELAGAQRVLIDTRAAEIDLAGAWLLRQFLRRVHTHGLEVQFASGTPATLTLLSRCIAGEIPNETRELQSFAPGSAVEEAVEDIGRRTVRGAHEASLALQFIGQTTVALARALLQPRRLRPISVSRQIFDSGITAVPIVALIAFLIAVILAYLGEQELRQFGATIFVVDLVTIGVLRELGVLLTAIIVAGRSGSAYAAEIGAMELNEEVDALRTIGVDPIEVLVLPRLLGLTIAMPLLTLVADLIGLAGGGVLCHLLLDMPTAQYLHRVVGAISSTTLWVGIIKAPMFAALIALAGCFNGMQVRVSSRELGHRTTVAVVQAIFCVILVDALFAVLFMRLDI